MSWPGAGMGALLGSRRGSLLGVVIGAVLGSWLEERARDFICDEAKADGDTGDFREITVLSAIAALLAKMAKVDGSAEEDEVRYCERAFDRLRLRGEKREYCVKVFRMAKSDAHTIYEYADSFAEDVPDSNVREIVYDVLWDCAAADDMVGPEELEALRRVVRHLRISGDAFVRQCSIRGIGGYEGGDGHELDPRELPCVGNAAGDGELMDGDNGQVTHVNAVWSEDRGHRGV